MNRSPFRHALPSLLGALALIVAIASSAAAQDMLASARAQYTSAEYESALVTLNQMRASGLVTDDVPAVEQYRALRLLALGRSTEAEDAMAAAVAAVPSFSPSGSDVSPRVKSTFVEVRRRVLPTIVQQKYTEAKTAFDRKDFVAAGDGFAQVLRVLDDPDLSSIASQPPLADMRTLARGFKDSSAGAALAIAAPSSAPPAAGAPSEEPCRCHRRRHLNRRPQQRRRRHCASTRSPTPRSWRRSSSVRFCRRSRASRCSWRRASWKW